MIKVEECTNLDTIDKDEEIPSMFMDPNNYLFAVANSASKFFYICLVLCLVWKIGSVAVMLHRIAKRKKSAPPFPNIDHPPVPHPHWLMGHMKDIGGDQKNICVDHADPITGISTFWTMHTPVLSFLHATDVKIVLGSNYHRKLMPSLAKHFIQLLGKNSLIMTTGKQWSTNRRLVHCAFLPDALKKVQPLLCIVSRQFAQCILNAIDHDGNNKYSIPHKNGNSTSADNYVSPYFEDSFSNNKKMDYMFVKGKFRADALRISRMATLDTFGAATLGCDFGCTSGSLPKQSLIADYYTFMCSELLRRCYKQVWNPAAQYYWIPTIANWKYARTKRKLLDALKDIVGAVRKDSNTKNEDPSKKDGKGGNKSNYLSQSSLFHNFISAERCRFEQGKNSKNEKEQYSLSEEFLSDFLQTLLFGGYDTSSNALVYSLYCIARHPHVDKNLAEEASIVLGDRVGKEKDFKHIKSNKSEHFSTIEDGIIDVEEQLPYCNAVIMEAMRLYPPVRNVIRNLHKPFIIEKKKGGSTTRTEVPAGSRVLISLWWVNRHHKNFDRPDEFLPQRWVRRKKRNFDAMTNDDDLVCQQKLRWKQQSPWEYRDPTQKSKFKNDEEDEDFVPPGDRSNLMAYSFGARDCVGKKFAQKQVITILSYLMRDVTVQLDNDYKLEVIRSGTNQCPKGGMPMTFQRRQYQHRK